MNGEARMPNGQRNPNQRDRFAVAMALGHSVSAWAKANGVPRRTCQQWKKTEEFKLRVEDVRRRTIDRVVGHYARNLIKAAGQITHLATEAKSESVQLQASRALVKDWMAVRQHLDYDERITELERKSAAGEQTSAG